MRRKWEIELLSNKEDWEVEFSSPSDQLTFEIGNAVPYKLPIASEDQLGGVQPITKTEEMVEPVGVDEDGKLWVNASKQLQADWLQDDKLAQDYIKNKPVDLATTEYVDEKFESIPIPDVSEQISVHNEDKFAHKDIRNLIPTKLSGLENDVGYITLQHIQIASDEDIIELLIFMDMMPAITDENGALLCNENGEILMW